LKKAEGEATKPVIAKGKLVGADLIVTGKLIPEGDGYRASLKAVRVSDGTVLPGEIFRATGDDLATSLTPAMDRLLVRIGLERNPNAPPKLPKQAVELAARARELQYSGRLVEAQELYARALAKPSNAFGYEADYIKLMNDVGMRDWAEDRAKHVLESMPRDGKNVCARAQILIEFARRGADQRLAHARDALRAAASCGDPAVVNRALVNFAWAARVTHHPSALAARRRAEKLAASGSEYMRCEFAYLDYQMTSQNVDVRGEPEKRWLAVAESCRRAGHRVLAGYATANAAHHAFSPKQRIVLRQRAIELARSVGGTDLDDARRSLASSLRATGKPSEADELLMESIGARLRALKELQGGLTGPESRLDSDFLKRAKVDKSASSPSGGDELLAKAHRSALAVLVGEWASRTEPESVSQAAVYRGIQLALDPPKSGTEVEGLEGEELFKKRLSNTKLGLDRIEKLDDAPPRGETADLDQAMLVLVEWFFFLREKGAESLPMRKRLLSAAKKVSSWYGLARTTIDAVRLEAYVVADEGNTKQCVALLRSALGLVVDAPATSAFLLNEIAYLQKTSDPKAAVLAANDRVEFSKRVSPEEWLRALSALGVTAVGNDFAAVGKANDEILRLAKKFESDGFFESSAYAWDLAAKLDMTAAHAEGSLTAVNYMQARAKVLERLGDPLRTLQARADVLRERRSYFNHVYRNGAQAELERDPEVAEASRVFAGEVQALVSAGRPRDAVRLVTRVPVTKHISELIQRAIGWCADLEDSKEQPYLLGRLYGAQAVLSKTRAERTVILAKSRDAYLKAGDIGEAVWQAQRLVLDASGEDEVHDYMQACLSMADKKPAVRLDCLDGLSKYLYQNRTKVSDPARYRKYTTLALSNIAEVDKVYVPRVRYTHRTRVAMIAAQAGDLEAVKRLDREVREYYTKTAPNSYELAIHLGQLGRALDARNPALATELYLAFDQARGASDWWRAEVYDDFADAARRAGNAAAEKTLLDSGRQSAAGFPVYFYRYAMYPARAAIQKQAWRDAEKAYLAAKKELEKLDARHQPGLNRVLVGLALARAFRKDLDGASRALSPAVERLEQMQKQGQFPVDPCFSSHVLEVAAGIDAARGKCERSTELKNLAQVVRGRCSGAMCTKPASATVWCDKGDDYPYRAENACKAAFMGTPELFPR
jgi:hypothetical protein